MNPSVIIDCFPENALRYGRGSAVVAVDVIRATTTLATAVALGRRCYSVVSRAAASRLAARLPNALLAGEVGGVVAPGFEMNNSPAELARRTDLARPVVLLSSSGTKLIDRARYSDAVFIACFRNFEAVTNRLAERFPRVAIVGAGSRGEFREEDQMCCAWIARGLTERGYTAVGATTSALIRRWPVGSLEGVLASSSVDYLLRSGQARDLEFVLSHVGDLEEACVLEGDEIVVAGAVERGPAGIPDRYREPCLENMLT